MTQTQAIGTGTASGRKDARSLIDTRGFDERFAALFDSHFARMFRFLERLCGDPDLAADLAQEAFIRLCRRGSMPDRPEAWLATVSLNLFRNAKSKVTRRRQLLTPVRGEHAHSDPSPSPMQSIEAKANRLRVRAAIDGLPERERSLLLLHAEGYCYRDIADALGFNEASVGTLLARARRSFRQAWEASNDAS